MVRPLMSASVLFSMPITELLTSILVSVVLLTSLAKRTPLAKPSILMFERVTLLAAMVTPSPDAPL